jgi:hypothetical protein
MRQLLAGIDRQLAEAERQLLESLPIEEIRKIVDRMANLKVTKKNLELALQTESGNNHGPPKQTTSHPRGNRQD